MILFYFSLVCFTVGLLAWSIGELLKSWQIAIGMSIFFALGTVGLCIRTFIAWRHFSLETPAFFVLMMMSVFCITGLLLHMALMRTMILPVSSVIMVAVGILEQKNGFDGLKGCISFTEPLYWWGNFSLSLLYIGLGIAGSATLLGMICFWRRGKDLSEMHTSIREVTLKCPIIFSKLNWLVLFLLVMSIASYMMYGRLVTGEYWQWQPLYAVAVAVALGFGIVKHLSIHH